MKYIVEIDGERVTVELTGGYAVRVGERVLQARLTEVEGTPVSLLVVGDQVHRVIARRGDARGCYTIALDSRTLAAEALDERARAIRDLSAARAAAVGPSPLIAPMPGLIVRVDVGPGDEVAGGQGLVVMEAMKMENELRAPAPGVVRAVHAVAGTAVEKGALLVEFA